MDKYELTIKIDKLDKLVKSGDYVNAAKVADQLEWKKMKQWSVMSNAIDAFVATEKYEKARNVCIYAYNRKLGGRRLLATLMEMYIKLDEYDDAEEIYQEYVELAPRDVTGFILLYKLKRAQGAPVEELINILQNYKEKELDEEYEFELALLYSEAGLTDKCVKECDELVLWFSDGEYVEKALKLKQLYAPLTPRQEAKLAALEKMSSMQKEQKDYQNTIHKPERNLAYIQSAAAKEEPKRGYVTDDDEPDSVSQPEMNKGYDRTGSEDYRQDGYDSAVAEDYQPDSYDEPDVNDEAEQPQQPVKAHQEKTDKPEYVDDIENTTQWTPIEAEKPQHEPDYDINIKVPDYSVYDTRNVQQELRANVSEIMEAYHNREKKEALMDEVRFDNVQEDSDPTKEIIINKHQWRKASRNSTPAKVSAGGDIRPVPQTVQPADRLQALVGLRGDDIREVTQQMTLEQMSELVAQLQAEQERRKREAGAKNVSNSDRMDISQWISHMDDEKADSDAEGEALMNRATREIPVKEIRQEIHPVKKQPAKTTEKTVKEIVSDRAEHVVKQEQPVVSPADDDYEREEREALERTVREIAASFERSENKPDKKSGRDAEKHTDDMPDTAEFEEILDIEECLDDADLDIDDIETDMDEAEPDDDEADSYMDNAVADIENKSDIYDIEAVTDEAEPEDDEADSYMDNAVTGNEVKPDIYDIETDTGDVEPEDGEADSYIDNAVADIENKSDIYDTETGVDDDADEEIPDLENAINAGIEQIIDDNAKAALEKKDSKRYLLADEEKTFLDRYLYMSGMEKRLCKYIGAKRAEKAGKIADAGNIAVMGSRNTDKMAFAVNLFKALHVYDTDREQKLARISADRINERGYEVYADKLAGQTLVVENAGRLKREALVSMMKFRGDTLFIIIDEEFEINKLFAENPDFAEKFTGCFLLKQYTVNELVDIAKDYAESKSWRVEDKALLKLYLILSQIPNDDQGNVVDLVKDIMEHAAKHAGNRLGNKLFGRFRAVLVIKESDLGSDDEYEDDEEDDEELLPDEEDTQEQEEKPEKEKKFRLWKKKQKESSEDDEEPDDDYDDEEYDDDYDDDYDDEDDE